MQKGLDSVVYYRVYAFYDGGRMEGVHIGWLAKTAQVNIETIRYYERRGLIPKAPRRASGYRQFSQKDVERLRFIKHAKALGFTLDEVTELLALKVEPAATCGDVSARIEHKLMDVEGKIKTLNNIKKALIRLKKACKEPGAPSKDCPILESLDGEEARGEKTVK